VNIGPIILKPFQEQDSAIEDPLLLLLRQPALSRVLLSHCQCFLLLLCFCFPEFGVTGVFLRPLDKVVTAEKGVKLVFVFYSI